MWFKHIKANEVANGAMAVDLRAGFGDKSYGSIVLNKYKVASVWKCLTKLMQKRC